MVANFMENVLEINTNEAAVPKKTQLNPLSRFNAGL